MELTASPILRLRASLGEGPLWDVQKSVLHWLDINNNLVHTFNPASGNDTFIDVGEMPGCIVKRRSGGFVLGLPEKFVALHGDTITNLATVEQGLGNRMNDGKCDPAGRFWCGSMHPKYNQGVANLWMMDLDLRVEKKLSNVTISNGLAWSSDNKVMYYIDTKTNNVDAFDYDIASGAIANRRAVIKNIWGGYFDGMTIDKDDNLYIAVWDGGCVLKINPATGALLSKINVPGVKNVTCPTFGGQKMNELFITSSAEGADEKAEPNAGALFHLELPDTQGLPAFEFAG
ncbi:MAG: SMP-30/gluconolactonase/LRE family protein [Cyanobacteria bacterium SZAS LIN-3]|nr:SMP-30/gluconolactonase/LRE family protein [Cyanobacteria bacterium SZAS LIN-3]